MRTVMCSVHHDIYVRMNEYTSAFQCDFNNIPGKCFR